MKRWQMVLVAAVVLCGAVGFGGTYSLDPVHSIGIFRIKHNNTSYVYGRINAPEGTVVYDAAKPEATTFDITMKAANIDTGNAARDTHLKSPSFLNAKEMPDLTFKSTAVKKSAEGDALDVTGDFTIHGVTKSITVKMDHTGDGNMNGKATVGFEGTFTIKRSDFGMKEMLDAVGDEVRVTVSIEADGK